MTPRELAQAHLPIIYQVYEDPKDLIQGIYFAEFWPYHKPAVYYELVNYPDCQLLIYCVFHRHDWSNSSILPIRRLDSHDFDFEGWIKCFQDGKVVWACTRAHHELLFANDLAGVTIESQGHGIYPRRLKLVGKEVKVYSPQSFNGNLIDMSHPRMKEVYGKFKEYGGVNSWREWYDWRIRQRFGLRTERMLAKEPMKYFRLAKKSQLFA